MQTVNPEYICTQTFEKWTWNTRCFFLEAEDELFLLINPKEVNPLHEK